MLVPFEQDANRLQLWMTARELEVCNESIGRHGLSLSAADIEAIAVGRSEALRTTARVEFGGGVAKELVLSFAGSPFVSQSTFVQTVVDLQELFYDFKNESLELIPDIDLIAKMRWLFDEVANGDLTYLEEALFEGIGRAVKDEPLGGDAVVEFAAAYDDAADPDADNAVANAYTLAQHRYDVAKWVDDTYAPGWEGSSWLDE